MRWSAPSREQFRAAAMLAKRSERDRRPRDRCEPRRVCDRPGLSGAAPSNVQKGSVGFGPGLSDNGATVAQRCRVVRPRTGRRSPILPADESSRMTGLGNSERGKRRFPVFSPNSPSHRADLPPRKPSKVVVGRTTPMDKTGDLELRAGLTRRIDMFAESQDSKAADGDRAPGRDPGAPTGEIPGP